MLVLEKFWRSYSISIQKRFVYNFIHEGFNISNISTKCELKKSVCCGIDG